jgi:hypothetical protein
MSLGGDQSQKVSQKWQQYNVKSQVRVGACRIVSFDGGWQNLTLNQRVPGSSPGAPTNQVNYLAEPHREHLASFYRSFYSLRSPFLPLEPFDRGFRQHRALAEVVAIEDHMNISQAMAGDAGDFLRRGSRK